MNLLKGKKREKGMEEDREDEAERGRERFY
jgi:hypothetical protein